MSENLSDFDILQVKARDVNVDSHILIQEGVGIQEHRVISLTSKDGKLIMNLRNLYSLDYKTVVADYTDLFHLVSVKQERKLITEQQIIYRGHC